MTTLCRAAAETLVRSGSKVLLLDLTKAAIGIDAPTAGSDQAGGASGWVPGASGVRDLITRHADGYDVLVARPHQDTRFLFNNSRRMRLTMAEELSAYSAIVVDLPPLLGADASHINPMAAAMLCDSVLLVCVGGRSAHADVRACVALANTSGVKLSGTVFNDFGATTMADQISHTVRHRLGFIPGLANRLERMAQSSSLLR